MIEKVDFGDPLGALGVTETNNQCERDCLDDCRGTSLRVQCSFALGEDGM